MRKWFALILVLCLLPLSVFARTTTKEDVLQVIQNIQNVQVDDEVKILSVNVEEEMIEVTLLENDLPEIRYIPYTFEKNSLSLQGGQIDRTTLEITNNQYAFYLYSILESMSTSPYEEESYYNSICIQNKVKSLLPEVKEKSYQNTGKTFGLSLEELVNNQFTIMYYYYLDGDDTILIQMKEDNMDGFKNPSTGTFGTFVTITLLIVIALAFYTYSDKGKIKKRG